MPVISICFILFETRRDRSEGFRSHEVVITVSALAPPPSKDKISLSLEWLVYFMHVVQFLLTRVILVSDPHFNFNHVS